LTNTNTVSDTVTDIELDGELAVASPAHVCGSALLKVNDAAKSGTKGLSV